MMGSSIDPRSPSLLAVLFLLALLAGCAAAPQPMSLEDAAKITGAFRAGGVVPPPRGGGAEELAGWVNTDTACIDEPLKPLDIEAIIKSKALSRCFDNCAAETLFQVGQTYMDSGRYTDAITLFEKGLDLGGFGYDQMWRPQLSRCYAYLGDYGAAWRNMGGGRTDMYKTTTGRIRVRVYYNIGRGVLNRMQGRYRDAESDFLKAMAHAQRGIETAEWPARFYDNKSEIMVELGEVMMLQGRLLEAEMLLRDANCRGASLGSGFNQRIRVRLSLSHLFFLQQHYADAALMARAALGTAGTYGQRCSAVLVNEAHQALARALLAQGRVADAIAEYDAIERNMRFTPEVFASRFGDDPDRAYALVAAGQYDRALPILTEALASAQRQTGSDSYTSAEIEGLLAAALWRTGDRGAAASHFRSALPRLSSAAADSGDGDGRSAVDGRRLAYIVEAYLDFSAADPAPDAASITFPVADTARGRSVQAAVVATSARAAAGDSRLADLVRRDQDAGYEIDGLRQALVNVKSQTTRDASRISALEARIAEFQKARAVIRDEIDRNFPDYAALIRPLPGTVPEIQKNLRPDEALVAFFIGEARSFVWGVPPTGPAAFVEVPLGRAAVTQMVNTVRSGITPAGMRLTDLPDFDTAAAYDLYQAFLAPVKATWSSARHLIVIPHGPLGHLPLGMLLTSSAGPLAGAGPILAEYRTLPWLAREVAVTVSPSVSALLSLRRAPVFASDRRAFAGFGDPRFNVAQAEADGGSGSTVAVRGASSGPSDPPVFATRAIRLTEASSLDDAALVSVSLSGLQPLYDTREEILAIAGALGADPQRDVFLGSNASESAVKGTDLSDRRVLVFATHGLLPGDLNGLDQPALALSAPEVTGDTANDGLLTMGEIFGLDLNADWVVLSACNTAAGEGKGAEAVSGLGRAFFYAGARSLLVSNWPVETVSARLLTTDIFRRQAADPTLSRAEALRRSMLDLMDHGVYRDPATGAPVFAYAHPIFWAPFSLVGEGGR